PPDIDSAQLFCTSSYQSARFSVRPACCHHFFSGVEAMTNRGALVLTAVWILSAGLFCPLYAQVGNSVLTGSVEDATAARIPGVNLVATNTQTGLQTSVL